MEVDVMRTHAAKRATATGNRQAREGSSNGKAERESEFNMHTRGANQCVCLQTRRNGCELLETDKLHEPCTELAFAQMQQSFYAM